MEKEKKLQISEGSLGNGVNTKLIKNNIKNEMIKQNIDLSNLSKSTKIKRIKLMLLLYFPPYRIKLSQAIKVCKALGIKVSDIVG